MSELELVAPKSDARGPDPSEPASRRSGLITHEGLDHEDQRAYRIIDSDRMTPFLMTVASPSDFWLFVSSLGGITAGRVSPEEALFPYVPSDQLHDAHHTTGPTTVFQVVPANGSKRTWTPFSSRSAEVQRCLVKNTVGNQLSFEEYHLDLGLTFRYRWATAEPWGLIRTASIHNHAAQTVRVRILDGIRNILPWGVSAALNARASCLVDAYKQAERDSATGLAVYSLTTRVSDLTDPVEIQKANTVWSVGLPDCRVGLAPPDLTAFAAGGSPSPAGRLTGQRGNYLLTTPTLPLEPGASIHWHLVCNVGSTHAEIVRLNEQLRAAALTGETLESAIRQATVELTRLVARADGLQCTNDPQSAAHHFANVLFNSMRGGIPLEADRRELSVARQAFFRHCETPRPGVESGQSVDETCAPCLGDDPPCPPAVEDATSRRLAREFLPLTFSRRHGDPSRPWNQFAIRTRGRHGMPLVHYEGNWRDIFQNWEALAVSFPEYLEGMIARFVNAITVDGYNPYRVTSEGLEWEVPLPDDPWSNVGYWGDHQIVYVLRLLESLREHQPTRLHELLLDESFAYFQVPYRLKSYRELVLNGRQTIVYDEKLAKCIENRVREFGQDGKLLRNAHGEVEHVSLLEKLLVPALAKLSNLVVEGGIWLNTQRPEWNDANNALVGHGLSVVTVAHLVRYLAFLPQLMATHPDGVVTISREVAHWLKEQTRILATICQSLDASASAQESAGQWLSELGQTYCDYRTLVYEHGFSGRAEVPLAELHAWCRAARRICEHTLRANQRPDGLYHSYNLVSWGAEPNCLQVRHLYEMLEGQVAVLSAGILEPGEAVELIQALFVSRLWREDQNTFVLYPIRELPDFLDRNILPTSAVDSNPLLAALAAAEDKSLIERDLLGQFRFQSRLCQQADVEEALVDLGRDPRWLPLVARHSADVVSQFRRAFGHDKHTGRSGSMYAFEGIGCVYWHMVAKLLLAIQENFCRACATNADPADRVRLRELYYRVRGGLGFEKSPSEFGAFPLDPYSHTPLHAGAQQPGMTGQVKEEILTRFGELGVLVRDGCLHFEPELLRRSEFLLEPTTFQYFDTRGEARQLELSTDRLAFTYCQVPVVYFRGGTEPSIHVVWHDDRTETFPGRHLPVEISQHLFDRSGQIRMLDVTLALEPV